MAAPCMMAQSLAFSTTSSRRASSRGSGMHDSSIGTSVDGDVIFLNVSSCNELSTSISDLRSGLTGTSYITKLWVRYDPTRWTEYWRLIRTTNPKTRPLFFTARNELTEGEEISGLFTLLNFWWRDQHNVELFICGNLTCFRSYSLNTEMIILIDEANFTITFYELDFSYAVKTCDE